jgi:hypothetical protein
MAQASERYRELAARSRRELSRVLDSGEQPSVAALEGHEFRGLNHFWWAPLLGIRKFIKAFFRASSGEDFGCNTPVQQNGLDGDWIAKPSEEAPKRYAFFLVTPDAAGGRGLLLDYGRGHNRFLDPSRFIRDELVRVDPGSDDLLLGKARLALGPLRVPLGYFLLERHRPLGATPALRDA